MVCSFVSTEYTNVTDRQTVTVRRRMQSIARQKCRSMAYKKHWYIYDKYGEIVAVSVVKTTQQSRYVS